MKKVLFCVALLSCVAVRAQLPSRSTSLTLDARAVSTGGATSVSGSSGSQPVVSNGVKLPVSASTSSQNHRHESKIRLQVEMRNLGTLPAGAHLEWYFVARHLMGGSTGFGGFQYIWDTGGRDVSVAPGSTDKEEIESSALVQTSIQTSTAPATNYINGQLHTSSGSGSISRLGATPVGWIVRLMDGDQTLRVQASSSDLEVIARDRARLKELFKWSPNEVIATQPPILKPVGTAGR